MRSALSVTLVVLAGCAGDLEDRGVSVRDSAGVRIVESASPAWTEAGRWRAFAQPIVRIGASEAEETGQLFQVRGAARLSNGNIVVLNSGAQEIRFYTPEGQFIRTAGRSGAGPGEFASPLSLLVYRGDTLIINDLERVSAFDSAGAFARVYSIGRWSIQGRFADGAFLQLLIPPGKDPFLPGYFRPDYAIVRTAPDGSAGDTVGYVPGDELFRSEYMNGMSNYLAPFGRVRAAAVHGDSLYTGDGSTFEIHDLDESGALVRIVRRSADPVPVMQDDIAALEARLLAGNLPDALRKHRQGIFEKWSYPAFKPAYDHLLVDSERNVWVRHYSAGTPATEWSVFEAGGRWLGEFAMPNGLDVKQIGRDYVIGVSTDELGVESVLVYALEKP